MQKVGRPSRVGNHLGLENTTIYLGCENFVLRIPNESWSSRKLTLISRKEKRIKRKRPLLCADEGGRNKNAYFCAWLIQQRRRIHDFFADLSSRTRSASLFHRHGKKRSTENSDNHIRSSQIRLACFKFGFAIRDFVKKLVTLRIVDPSLCVTKSIVKRKIKMPQLS